MKDMEVGFIGIGVMGKSMAANLLGAGYPLSVYTRTRKKADDLIERGAVWRAPKEMAENCKVVVTMLGYPKDVEETYFGEQGIFNYAKPGSYVVDMTTSSPKLAKKIAEAAAAKNIHALDAPVSGGDIGARDGKLAIMVGGEKRAFDDLKPVFSVLGTNIRYLGEAGAGQFTKMCNQIAIASNMMGVCEAVAYAKKVGLDPAAVLDTISTGAAGSWSLSNLAPRMLRQDFAPGFFVKHFIKDMTIALESAEEANLKLPGLALAKSLYERLAAEGGENLGTQALIQLIEGKH